MTSENTVSINRNTNETEVAVQLNINGQRVISIEGRLYNQHEKVFDGDRCLGGLVRKFD